MSTATAVDPRADIVGIQDVPARIVAAWAAQDGDAFAEVFTQDGTMTLPDAEVSTGRDAIRTFMSAAFAGPYAATRVTGTPVGLRMLGPDVAVVITRGGVLAAGESAVAPERAVNATWVVVRDGAGWSLAAYHNSPVAG